MQSLESFRRSYLIGACIVWVGIILATAVVLGGTPHVGTILPILIGGVVWFVIIIPGALSRVR